MSRRQKLVVTLFVVLIVVVALIGVVPMVMRAMLGPGIKTEGLDASGAEPAATGIDGEWALVRGHGGNTSAVGFTFDETLPGERRETSGTTHAVDGGVTVRDQELVDGSVVVDMGQVATDNEKRDINVRTKIFETDTYPTAEFRPEPGLDLSGVPDDGTAGEVELRGDLTIHGRTRTVSAPFTVLRDGVHVVISGDIPINRTDFDVESPEFVAAVIEEQGEVNVRLVFAKE